MPQMCKLRLIDATRVLPGERASKLIDPKCEVGVAVQSVRDALDAAAKRGELPFVVRRRPMHIELLGRADDKSGDILIQRASVIDGTNVDVSLVRWFKGALVIPLGQQVPNVLYPHITIDFFGDNTPQDKIDAIVALAVREVANP